MAQITGERLNALVAEIDADMRAQADPSRAARDRAYLKSDLIHIGVSVPAVRSVATSVRHRLPCLGHDRLVELVEQLWSEPVHERRLVCVELLDTYADTLDPTDLRLLERLLREARTWALVDSLSANVAGKVVDANPEAAFALDHWASDSDFWLRRASMLTLLVPLRKGFGDFERFGRYADAMLEENEFFIRKAIGWVLRDTAKKRPDLVVEWLLPRAKRASGVTVREALKPLSEVQRQAILSSR